MVVDGATRLRRVAGALKQLTIHIWEYRCFAIHSRLAVLRKTQGCLQRGNDISNEVPGITVMKYVVEFRNRAVATALAERIEKTVRRP